MSKGKGMKQHNKVVWAGFSNTPVPRHIAKVGRNDPCLCGSGKKYKDCHERDGEIFLQKIAREADKERLRVARAQMKARGVPWYQRIFVRL